MKREKRSNMNVTRNQQSKISGQTILSRLFSNFRPSTPNPRSPIPISLFTFHFSLFTFLFSLFSFLFLSCQSAPTPPDALIDKTGFVPLGQGASVYIFADAKKAGPILESLNINGINGLDNKQFRQMLDRTQFVMAAVYPSASSPAQTQTQRLQLAAWGNYPVSGAGMAMTFSKDWKKVRSPEGKNYWYSEKNGVSLALEAKQAFVVIGGNSPAYPVSAAPGATVPEGFTAFRNASSALGKDAVISCWIENPAASFNQFLRKMEIPIELPAEKFFVSIIPLNVTPSQENARQYEALLQIQVATATQARGLAAVISLARNFISTDAADINAVGGNANNISALMVSLLFANPPVQDGNNINIKTGLLSAGEISLLFNLFSIR